MRVSIHNPDHDHFADAATTVALLTDRPTHLIVHGDLRAVRAEYPRRRYMLATYNAPGWPSDSWLVQFCSSTAGEEWTLAECCHVWLVDAFDATFAQMESLNLAATAPEAAAVVVDPPAAAIGTTETAQSGLSSS